MEKWSIGVMKILHNSISPTCLAAESVAELSYLVSNVKRGLKTV